MLNITWGLPESQSAATDEQLYRLYIDRVRLNNNRSVRSVFVSKQQDVV